MDSAPKELFQSMYAGQAPWDIGKPQPMFVAVADQIAGSVLDAGCGTGEHTLFFAGRGCKATGIDFVEEAIARAKHKAAARGLCATFLIKDALALKDWDERFDNAIDSGLFHGFSDADRQRYVTGLAAVVKFGGRLFLACFSDREPGTEGPRRISEQELRDAFSQGWTVESVRASRFEVIPTAMSFSFSEGGPKAWLAVIRRVV